MQILFEKVKDFLATPSPLPKLVIIYGPTACGKTAFSIELAKQVQGEVIGADSRQIYRYLDIGTGKVTEAEKQGIPHHMIDIRNPDESYSVAEFQEESVRIAHEIHARGNIPILCGGTGLYIDAVTQSFDIPTFEPDWEYRDELEALRKEHGNEYIWNLLHTVDPKYASELHPNNHRYIIRALEVLKHTGQSKQDQKTASGPFFDTLFITPYDGDRARLYEKINGRIREMFETGLIEEVRSILDQ